MLQGGARTRNASRNLYFSSVQALRGVAAVLVVAYHLVHAEHVYGQAERILTGVVRFRYAGVDLFFVISGFVMAAVTAGQYGSLRGAGQFLMRRAIRILPMYWLATSVIVALLLTAPHLLDASYQDKSVLASYLLWPQSDLPHLQVGWTLVYEAYFYLWMAAAVAFLPGKRLPTLLCGWGLLLVALQFAPKSAAWVTVVSSPMGWEFITGALIGVYWQRLPIRAAPVCFILGVVGFVIGATALNRIGLFDEDHLLRTLVFGFPSALIVLGLVRWEAAGLLRVPRRLRELGEASYSIYLTHLFVLTVIARLWGASGLNQTIWGHIGFIVVAIAASIIGGMASYRWLERPLLALGEGWIKRSSIGRTQTI